MPILKHKEEPRSLAAELSELTKRLREVNDKINLTDDDDLLDALIFEELSLRARCRQVIKEARKKLE